MKKPASVAVPAVLPLRVNDLLFVNEYLKPDIGLNATEAYRRLHPTVKYETAMSQACRLLKKPQVQAEVQRRTRAAGISKEWGEARLREYEDMAYAKQDYVAGASICMDAMKLAGFLVEKREQINFDGERANAVRSLIARALTGKNRVTATEPATEQPQHDSSTLSPTVNAPHGN